MLILTVYHDLLENTPAVAALSPGGFFIERVAQDAPRPNTLFKLGDGGEDMTHRGPGGLRDVEIIVTARGDTAKAAALLGAAIRTAMNGWGGTMFDHWVQLTEFLQERSNYDEPAKVFEHIQHFTSFYQKVA